MLTSSVDQLEQKYSRHTDRQAVRGASWDTHTECTHTKDKTFAGMYRIDILKSEVKLSCLLIINKVMVFVCLFVMDVVCSYSKILQNENLLLVLFPFNVWNKG